MRFVIAFAMALASPGAGDEAARFDPAPQVLTVRRRGGLPERWVARIRRADGVRAVARTRRAQALLRRAVSASGRVVDAPPSGYAIPLDVLVADARALARVVPEDARPAVRRLRRGTALLSETSARLRRVGVGGRLTLTGGSTLRVAGVVDDEIANNSELVLRPGDAPPAGATTARLLVATTDPEAVERALPRDRLTRVGVFGPGGGGGTTRGGIARAMEVKRGFGEFAVRLPYGSDWIGIEPGWLRRNVVTRRVPILGTVSCHRRLIAPLRRALTSLRRQGLSRLVDAGDYAGCYAPRRIPGSGSLSLHAWGLAIDVNASRNPQFGASRQDPRLVRVMERAGFTWGGRWPTAPDPMHFELHP
jgi:hypothetical protein